MITEEQINALIAHCKRQKEKSFSLFLKEEHSDTLECLEELLYLIKSTKWHDLKENPNDLPPLDEECKFSNYVLVYFDKNPHEKCSIPFYEVACYDYNNEIWFGDNDDDVIYRDAVAWMELPQFKKEDKQWKL
jgi:hypothetical protein